MRSQTERTSRDSHVISSYLKLSLLQLSAFRFYEGINSHTNIVANAFTLLTNCLILSILLY